MAGYGDTGYTGYTGPKGDDAPGPTGIQGMQGPQGPLGPIGPRGARGFPAFPGAEVALQTFANTDSVSGNGHVIRLFTPTATYNAPALNSSGYSSTIPGLQLVNSAPNGVSRSEFVLLPGTYFIQASATISSASASYLNIATSSLTQIFAGPTIVGGGLASVEGTYVTGESVSIVLRTWNTSEGTVIGPSGTIDDTTPPNVVISFMKI
jgi:hypothetical protein